jgi:hypothetical protein
MPRVSPQRPFEGAHWLVVGFCLTASCAAPLEPLSKDGQIEGNLELPAGTRGDGLVFLYGAGQGPPLRQAVPVLATGVSDVRIEAGDTAYVLSQVPPNPYRLWGFLDVDRSFQPAIDVLAQPGVGDRVAAGVDLNLEPAQDLVVDLPISTIETLEPPAFHLSGVSPGDTLQIPDQVSLTTFTLVADDLGLLTPGKVAFAVSLPDAGDPNAAPDPLGVPTLYPQVFLRFVPKPGQTVPQDASGNPDDVIVPLVFDPAPYLPSLALDGAKPVLVSTLAAAVVPQAEAISYSSTGKPTVTALPAVPVGDYELWVLAKSGQFWRLPNDLATDAGVASQNIHFRVFHGVAADAGP